jgi:hypothetical protein
VINGEEEWEVEKILAVKLVRNKLRYQVSWVGYDPDPEWYPASNFMSSPYKLSQFHQEYPHLPGPPKRLAEWVQEWEKGTENYDHLKDDSPIVKKQSLRV